MKTIITKSFLSAFLVFLIIIPAFCADYYKSGKEFYYKQNYKNASQYFQKALNQKPLNANYRYYYAQTLVYLGDLDKAQSEYSKIIEISPDSEAANLSVKAIANIQKYYNGKNSSDADVSDSVLADKSFNNDNYVTNAITNSGDIFIWDKKKMPVKIYFLDSKKTKGYTPEHLAKVKQAFEVWKKAFKGQISYKYVNDKKQANIFIIFKEKLSSNDDSNDYMAGLTKPYPVGHYLDKVSIQFATIRTADGKPVSLTALYNCALHEIGHSLGIYGHSSIENDIMYPVTTDKENNTQKSLSNRDINTINDIYSLSEQDLIASKDKSNKLGDKSERLKKKLQEDQEYVKKVPNDPIGWTQLGLTYMSGEDYNNAVTNFQKALSLNPAYKTANEGMAEAYANKNEPSTAEKYYKYLIKNYPKEKKQFYNFALFYINVKQNDKAKLVLDKYISNDYTAKNDKDIQNLFDKINK
ncbi:MAG: matrixin family metalloprotease [Candidatus Gastranaerophilaceae bacterium]|jgi:tetratricopeptide (TPR) repeat protein